MSTDPVLNVLHELRKTVIQLALATAASYILLAVAFSITLWLRSEDQAEANRQRQAAALENCREIQELKYQNRRAALQSFRRRHETARFLRLEYTPEVDTIFQRNLNEALARNESRSCKTDPIGERKNGNE